MNFANAAGSTPNRAAYAASLEGPATPEVRAANLVAAGGGTSGTRPGAAAVSMIDDKIELIFMCKCTLCVCYILSSDNLVIQSLIS